MNETPLILVVDDDSLLQQATAHLLSQAGYRTCQASDGRMGLQVACEQKPDLVLLNVVLPDLSGIEVCRRIKAETALSDCSVILLAGTHIDLQSQVAGLEGGADEYIMHPVTNEELLVRVCGMLRLKQAEDRLRESEDKFAKAFQTSPIAISLSLPNGQYIEVNDAFTTIIGYTCQEALANTSVGLNLWVNAQDRQEVGAALAAGQAVVGKEIQFRCKSGNIILGLFSAQVLHLKQGLCVFSSINDITERKRVEEALRESQALTSAIVDSTSDMIWSVDATSFGLLTFNKSLSDHFRKQLGIQIQAGMHIEDIFPTQDYVQKWYGFYLRALLQGRFTTEYVTYSGLDALQMTFNLLKRNDQVYGISVFGKDITERKQAEKELSESESRFREVLENSLDASYKRNLQTNRYDYFSPVFKRISGYHIDEFISLSLERVLDLIHPDDHARGDRVLAEAFASAEGTSFQWDYRFKHKDGHYRWFRDRFVLMRDAQGEPAALIGSVSDITESKQHENELQAIATLSAALRTAPTRAEMGPVIVQQLSRLLHCDSIAVEIIDPIANESVVESATGVWSSLIGYHQPLGTGMNTTVQRTRQPYHTNHFSDDGRACAPGYWVEGLVATAGVPLIAQEQLIGFIWIGRKTEIAESEVSLLVAIADMAANAIHRATLHEQTRKDAADLARAYDTTLEGWVQALELRDHETEGHTRRVVQMTLELARQMGIAEIELEHVRRGALLHDIGKMGIPDSVLLKPGTLDEREWEIMRRHPEYANEFLKPIEYLHPSLDIPYCHHEKWDGTGYPRGLKGEAIPLAARLFAIVDVWDALTSDRPYRRAWSGEQAYHHIQEQTGKHFDPTVAEQFLRLMGLEQPQPTAKPR